MNSTKKRPLAECLPAESLLTFLNGNQRGRLLVLSLAGPAVCGYAHKESPIELKGLHAEPTEALIGLTDPPKTYNWVGEYDGLRIDYTSMEIGYGLKRLLRGDGSILERILSPEQLLLGDDLRRLQLVSQGAICRRLNTYYRNLIKTMIKERGENDEQSVRLLLGVYRAGLTGVHLLSKGEIVLDLTVLAAKYHFENIDELIELYKKDSHATLPHRNKWTNRLIKLHVLLDNALAESQLPIDPPRPLIAEAYLLEIRKRYYDAPTEKEVSIALQ